MFFSGVKFLKKGTSIFANIFCATKCWLLKWRGCRPQLHSRLQFNDKRVVNQCVSLSLWQIPIQKIQIQRNTNTIYNLLRISSMPPGNPKMSASCKMQKVGVDLYSSICVYFYRFCDLRNCETQTSAAARRQCSFCINHFTCAARTLRHLALIFSVTTIQIQL